MDDETREMLHQTATSIFADGPPDLWEVLQSVGFDKALVPESKGGVGVSWVAACELLGIAGKYAAAVPMAEAMIGHWLLNFAGIEDVELPTIAFPPPSKPFRLSRSGDEWHVDGALVRVPWGRACTHVAFMSEGPAAQLIVVARDAAGVSMTPGQNLAGEPRDDMTLEGVVPLAVVPVPFEANSLLAIAAVMRSALMAGAIEHALALTVDYANMRVQFGRPIGKFQAVQQNIAVLATQAAAARAASEAGGEAIDGWLADTNESLAHNIDAVSAKIRTGEAAGQASAIAHQVFGAIGFTEEHELHRFTKRLWSWRDECGNEAFWAEVLGQCVLADESGKTLWRTLTPAGSALELGATR
ncbi:acyl-CoA dehydrogenase [Arthrobacter sp. StoSoilB13]|uniref:acyl-CoA dehydrogenase n=1 Tax=Arthrobacter sp. StoSoilB13 TaxID=2830993 RepID=UPI001CC63B0F|nr:acyl-CoA dehydrogenase [Arthrobacter sp. StoSoilB13]BCW48066.1 acyl-CoA dehydrogenase [Arthrobacter sp. StoSoilB13]